MLKIIKKILPADLVNFLKKFKKNNIFEKIEKNENTINYFRSVETPADVKEMYEKVLSLYEYYFDNLYILLNKIHKKNYSRKYWRIIIGPWLAKYITIIYEKYSLFVKSKLTNSGEFQYPGDISPMWELYYYETVDFRDDWNQYLQSQVQTLCLNFGDKSREEIFKIDNIKPGLRLRYFFREVKYFFNIINYFIRNRFIPLKGIKKRKFGVSDNYKYMLVSEKLRLFDEQVIKNENLFKIERLEIENIKLPDFNLRKKFFLNKLYFKDKFDFVFRYSLINNFPVYYLESFKYWSRMIKILYPGVRLRRITLFFELYEQVTVNFFTAFQVENFGCESLEMQHGGGYGLYKYMLLENRRWN